MRDRVIVPRRLTDLGGTFQEDPGLRLVGKQGSTEVPLDESGGVYADTAETPAFAGDGRCMAGLSGDPISDCSEFNWPCISQNGGKKTAIPKKDLPKIPMATVNGVPLDVYLAKIAGKK